MKRTIVLTSLRLDAALPAERETLLTAAKQFITNIDIPVWKIGAATCALAFISGLFVSLTLGGVLALASLCLMAADDKDTEGGDL